MQEIQQYTEQLLSKSKKHLEAEYHLEKFPISNFQALNFFLIDRAINKEHSLFIESFDKNLPALSQFPALVAVAASLFYKNYCDDITSIEPGVTLQNPVGEKFVYMGKTKDGHYLKNKRDRKYPTDHQLKKYLIVNSKLNGRIAKTKLKHYRNLYNNLFKVADVPSQFKYKAAIIMSKKEFEQDLKRRKNLDIDFKKAIPMRWIARSGKESWKHIPIEPMLYCVPDYDTLEEHVLNKGIDIETLVVIGKNKYKDDVSTRIRLALKNGDIPSSIILGSEKFKDDQNQFLKWQWTFPEYRHLTNKASGEIKVIDIEDAAYQSAIDDFITYLTTLEKENGITLVNVKRLRRFLYALTLSKLEDSRTLTQLEFVQHLITQVAVETIEADFYELGLDEDEVIEEIRSKIDTIFQNFGNHKLKYLLHKKFINYLIVPERLVENWREEFETDHHKICSIQEFQKHYANQENSKKVYVVSIYNNGMLPSDVLKLATNSHHRFHFLAYPEEGQVINNYRAQYFNELISEYSSPDRKKLTELNFELEKKVVVQTKSMEDLMEDLYHRENRSNPRYHYESQRQINYELKFEGNGDAMVYDGSKTLLLKKNGSWIKSKTYNLMPGDTVRLYSNLSKERLFEIAVNEDSNERFREIEEMSNLWKQELASYFSSRVAKNKYYDSDDLLKALQIKGSTIKSIVTINKWLDRDDKERFPHSDNELKAIKKLVDSEQLNNQFTKLLKIKKFYRGIMINLGRDLSDDVMDYIVSNKQRKGKVLSKFQDSEIQSFVISAAPVRVLKSKAITDYEESN